MNLVLRNSLAIILSLLLWTACEGPVGPAGSVGPEGPIGPEGPQGPQGDVGLQGNANVKGFLVSLSTNDFTTNNDVVETARYSNGMITTAVVDRGAVLAYTDLGTGLDEWVAIPLVIAGITLTYSVSSGRANVLLIRPAGSFPVASAFHGFRVRFVVIAPDQMSLLEGIDLADYSTITRILGNAKK